MTTPAVLTLDFCGFGRTCHIVDSKGRHALLAALDYEAIPGDGRMLFGLSETGAHRFDLVDFLPFAAQSFTARGLGSKPEGGVMRIRPVDV